MRADTPSAVQVEGMEIKTMSQDWFLSRLYQFSLKIVALGMPVDFPHDEAR